MQSCAFKFEWRIFNLQLMALKSANMFMEIPVLTFNYFAWFKGSATTIEVRKFSGSV